MTATLNVEPALNRDGAAGASIPNARRGNVEARTDAPSLGRARQRAALGAAPHRRRTEATCPRRRSPWERPPFARRRRAPECVRARTWYPQIWRLERYCTRARRHRARRRAASSVERRAWKLAKRSGGTRPRPGTKASSSAKSVRDAFGTAVPHAGGGRPHVAASGVMRAGSAPAVLRTATRALAALAANSLAGGARRGAASRGECGSARASVTCNLRVVEVLPR